MATNLGWLKFHRQMMEWEWYQDGNVVRLWIHLLFIASVEDKKWKGMDVKRGQVVTSLDHLSIALNLSIQQIRTALSKLESTGEIKRQATNKFTLVTISKYDDYQANESTDQQTDNNQITNQQQTDNNQITTSKEVKNIRNNNSLSIGADEKIFEEDEKKRDQDAKWISLMKMPFTTWIEDSCRLLGLNKEELNMYIDTFSLEMKAKCTYHSSWQDITSHFVSWVKFEREKHKKQSNNNNGNKVRQNDDRRPFEPSENANYHSQI